MSHDDGSPEVKREARSIARLIIIVIVIAAVQAVAVAFAWSRGW